ncbi:MAG: putative DNA binding domain-containing protein [Oscillospiraceae bacterium]|nr:putative DNA binding domain-containing protein [Oscillospiraceae bacterium]
MTKETILDLISQGEGVTIEFKECKNEVASEVYPTVCSFSNRFGGHILMGVNDDGEIIGVNPKCVKDMRKNFSNMLNNPQKIYPTLYLSAEEIEIDGKIILYVYVPKSSLVHTCNKITYDRIGDADINISSNTTQMSELYLRKQSDFTEKKLYPYLTVDELDMSLMERVRNLAKSKDPNHPWIKMSDMGIFRSAGLYERDFATGQEGFNLAAVLLFGKDETIKSCLPAYRTDAIYRVENLDRYDDRDDVRTNLIDSYERLTDFVCRHMNDKFYLEGTQRVSIRSIIAREIVSNILMHREYTNPYPAKIIIEKDRILTENANKTYHYGRIQADFFTPYSKNPIIAGFFNNIGRADELGSGVRNLYKYLKIYANNEPVLFEDDVFRAEIPIESIGVTQEKTKEKTQEKTKEKTKENHSEIKNKIIKMIEADPQITITKISETLDITVDSVKYHMKKMKIEGIIQHCGSTKNGYWKINK